MKRQVLIAIFCLSLVATATACSKSADQAGTANPGNTSTPSQTQTPSPTPSATPTPAPGTGNGGGATPTETPKPTPTPVVAPQGSKDQPVVNKDQFKNVQMGMSFAEVEKTMGKMGKLINESKNDDGSTPAQTYEYKFEDGSSVKVTFINGKVTSKSG
ncbi:hypothetical protein [Paenibacillus sp. H1-7]|uniref:hypothetical protein n=1 Tax=Paenibacillus sp. H1-7 TaxID=2282849 RepID=UPI001EF8EDAA|nr:hypothetical protein [Paenibacillus sp. H1-7]